MLVNLLFYRVFSSNFDESPRVNKVTAANRDAIRLGLIANKLNDLGMWIVWLGWSGDTNN